MIAPDMLALIPGCGPGRPPLAVVPLPGGRGCNHVWRVDTGEGRFVLRQRRAPMDRPGSPARTELRSQQIAAAAGIAPRLLDAATDGSWLLMEYIDAGVWTEAELLSGQGVERLGTRLAQLHALPAPDDVPQFDAAAIAAGYLRQLQAQDPVAGQPYQSLLSRVGELSRAMAGFAGEAVLNHGDLQPGNMLGAEPMLIDWEYAQVVDPTYDIACLLTYYPRLEAHLGRLLECAGLASLAERAVLTLQRERFACLNQLWNAVNHSKAG